MADLSMFATKKNANDGVWFPVQINGIKMPVALLLYGDDSDVVQDYNNEKLRKIRLNGDGVDDEVINDLIDSKDGNVYVRIGGISTYDWEKGENINEPVVLNGRTIKSSDKASIRFLVEQIPALKDFILKKTNERKNFLSERKENSEKQ